MSKRKIKEIIKLSEECDIITTLDNIKLEEKNIIYNKQKNKYVLDNMYNFNLIEFTKELELLGNDYYKINPLNELKKLISLGFFNKKMTITIKNYLDNDKIKEILNKTNIKINIEDIIKVEYNRKYEIINLKINKNQFWFYSPKRFCNELLQKSKNIIKSERKKIITHILNELEECVKNKLVSNIHKEETLCWIDFYKLKLKYNELF